MLCVLRIYLYFSSILKIFSYIISILTIYEAQGRLTLLTSYDYEIIQVCVTLDLKLVFENVIHILQFTFSYSSYFPTNTDVFGVTSLFVS